MPSAMAKIWKELAATTGILVVVYLLHVQAKFIVEKNRLNITSPASLKGSYNSALGNFGIPQYGGSLVGLVLYPNTTSTACIAFDQSFKSSKSGSLSPVLLVDRGDCFFALKVWNAQNAGAAAVLVADDREEALITMDISDEDKGGAYVENITIPSALIEKALGDAIKNALRSGSMVNINLDWRESLPHPDDRVEYEFWTNSNNICGPKCDIQINFLKNFKGAAQILERGGYSQFTPHYITWYCPEMYIFTRQCRSQCINEGRYCAPDPEQDFSQGYDGKDVVTENLRHICVFKIVTELEKPWVWWDYATDFQIRCPMREKKYNKKCAEQIINSLGLPIDKIQNCMGDPNANVENPVLREEQEAQMGHDSRGDVTILPTLIINNQQYRGKLDKGAVLKAICSGFKETTEPTVCLSEAVETNECLSNNGGCWRDLKTNVTACKDTFRGRICECPLVQGVQYQGDGYNHCEAGGSGRCKIGNGGCWQNTKAGNAYSACLDAQQKGCQCPLGFSGDGVDNCEDIDECKEKVACQCPYCKCKNTYGSYKCECEGNFLYIKEHDTCIGKMDATVSVRVGWLVSFVVLAAFAIAGLAIYVLYKYRLRSYMDSEIRTIMAQYMPLDNQNDVHQHLQEDF